MTEQAAGLRRKIWTAFILQAAAISFAAVLGVYGASAVLKHLLIQRALTEEAAHFWERSDADPAAAVPDTFNMTGFLVDGPASRSQLPKALHPLSEGYHSLPRAQGGALVSSRTVVIARCTCYSSRNSWMPWLSGSVWCHWPWY